MGFKFRRENLTGLCETCYWLERCETVDGKLHLHCSNFDKDLRAPIVDCTGYRDKRRATLESMEDSAWILRTDPKRKKIGFAAPGTEEHKNLLKENRPSTKHHD